MQDHQQKKLETDDHHHASQGDITSTAELGSLSKHPALVGLPAGDQWRGDTRAIYGSCNCFPRRQYKVHLALAAKSYIRAGFDRYMSFRDLAQHHFEAEPKLFLGAQATIIDDSMARNDATITKLCERLRDLKKRHGWGPQTACAYHLHCAAQIAGHIGLSERRFLGDATDLAHSEVTDDVRRGCSL